MSIRIIIRKSISVRGRKEKLPIEIETPVDRTANWNRSSDFMDLLANTRLRKLHVSDQALAMENWGRE
jgi:hypothetical protein